jgi:hypothetical protein
MMESHESRVSSLESQITSHEWKSTGARLTPSGRSFPATATRDS